MILLAMIASAPEGHPMSRARYLKCDAHDALGLEVEFGVVQEWCDGHDVLPCLPGGSATGLSATGA